MSPILVRPVREQLEHDRVIRLLQAKYKKKFEVGINPGMEQAVPVGPAASPLFPDVVLQSTDRSRKLLGVIEVETGESINHLEAMSQWATYARLRAPFFLYVPAGRLDATRRLCVEYKIRAAEIWTFHFVGDELRFTLIQKAPGGARSPVRRRPAASAGPKPRTAARSAAKTAGRKTSGASAKKTVRKAVKVARKAVPKSARKAAPKASPRKQTTAKKQTPVKSSKVARKSAQARRAVKRK